MKRVSVLLHNRPIHHFALLPFYVQDFSSPHPVVGAQVHGNYLHTTTTSDGASTTTRNKRRRARSTRSVAVSRSSEEDDTSKAGRGSVVRTQELQRRGRDDDLRESEDGTEFVGKNTIKTDADRNNKRKAGPFSLLARSRAARENADYSRRREDGSTDAKAHAFLERRRKILKARVVHGHEENKGSGSKILMDFGDEKDVFVLAGQQPPISSLPSDIKILSKEPVGPTYWTTREGGEHQPGHLPDESEAAIHRNKGGLRKSSGSEGWPATTNRRADGDETRLQQDEDRTDFGEANKAGTILTEQQDAVVGDGRRERRASSATIPRENTTTSSGGAVPVNASTYSTPSTHLTAVPSTTGKNLVASSAAAASPEDDDNVMNGEQDEKDYSGGNHSHGVEIEKGEVLEASDAPKNDIIWPSQRVNEIRWTSENKRVQERHGTEAGEKENQRRNGKDTWLKHRLGQLRRGGESTGAKGNSSNTPDDASMSLRIQTGGESSGSSENGGSWGEMSEEKKQKWILIIGVTVTVFAILLVVGFWWLWCRLDDEANDESGEEATLEHGGRGERGAGRDLLDIVNDRREQGGEQLPAEVHHHGEVHHLRSSFDYGVDPAAHSDVANHPHGLDPAGQADGLGGENHDEQAKKAVQLEAQADYVGSHEDYTVSHADGNKETLAEAGADDPVVAVKKSSRKKSRTRKEKKNKPTSTAVAASDEDTYDTDAFSDYNSSDTGGQKRRAKKLRKKIKSAVGPGSALQREGSGRLGSFLPHALAHTSGRRSAAARASEMVSALQKRASFAGKRSKSFLRDASPASAAQGPASTAADSMIIKSAGGESGQRTSKKLRMGSEILYPADEAADQVQQQVPASENSMSSVIRGPPSLLLQAAREQHQENVRKSQQLGLPSSVQVVDEQQQPASLVRLPSRINFSFTDETA
ncbi:unnamed protein product [Amoebophrya sp. A120]|nr:unnamed protein product [Amoebophrya sp. A120]|eukprot:GSA120T00012605001.1